MQLTVRIELPNDGLDDSGSGGHVPPADRHGWAQHHHHHYILHCTALHCTSGRFHSGDQLTAGLTAIGGARSGWNSRGDVTPLQDANSPPLTLRTSSRLILSQLSPLPVSEPRLRPSSSSFYKQNFVFDVYNSPPSVLHASPSSFSLI
jgi:hypothetical protein